MQSLAFAWPFSLSSPSCLFPGGLSTHPLCSFPVVTPHFFLPCSLAHHSLLCLPLFCLSTDTTPKVRGFKQSFIIVTPQKQAVCGDSSSGRPQGWAWGARARLRLCASSA